MVIAVTLRKIAVIKAMSKVFILKLMIHSMIWKIRSSYMKKNQYYSEIKRISMIMIESNNREGI